MSYLEDINSLISTETNKFISDMPSLPDNCMCIYDTDAYESIRLLNGIATYQPVFTIRVRDISKVQGDLRVQTIITTLDGVANININNHYYLNILLLSFPRCIGKDDEGQIVSERWIWEIDFKCQYYNL